MEIMTKGKEYQVMCSQEIIDKLSSRELLKEHSGPWALSYEQRIFSVDKENQLDVTFCILYFFSNSCSTCFGQPCAHHQELMTA